MLECFWCDHKQFVLSFAQIVIGWMQVHPAVAWIPRESSICSEITRSNAQGQQRNDTQNRAKFSCERGGNGKAPSARPIRPDKEHLCHFGEVTRKHTSTSTIGQTLEQKLRSRDNFGTFHIPMSKVWSWPHFVTKIEQVSWTKRNPRVSHGKWRKHCLGRIKCYGGNGNSLLS